MKKLRFIAHYENNEKVQGNPLGHKDSLWTSLPAKPIHALEYTLPYGKDSLKLSGYEAYLHMVEVCMSIGRNPQIEYVYIMGKTGNKITSYRITVMQNSLAARYKIGDITVRVYNAGKEYRGGATSGWRIGKEGITQKEK